jgi:signal transduction histidine kinase
MAGRDDWEGTLIGLLGVIDQLPNAVIVLDRAGCWHANAAAIALLGPMPSAPDAQALDALLAHLRLRCANEDQLIPPADHPFARALRGETCARDVVARDHRSGGELVLRCEARPLWERQQLVGAVISQVDITDLRRSTARLRRKNQDLEQFSAIASHDLQEPLRVIRGYLSLLELRPTVSQDEAARRYLAFAEESAARLQRMLANLLDITRISRQELRRVHFDASEAVAEALDGFAGMIKEVGATVMVGPMPTVFADRAFLVILLRNLVGNALKYRHPERACCIRIDAFQRAREVVFSVTDNGIGVAPEHRETIFVAFQRLPHQAGPPGNGLGLDICRRIVARHHGKIWVESVPGTGATFVFVLPQAPEHGALEQALDGESRS